MIDATIKPYSITIYVNIFMNWQLSAIVIAAASSDRSAFLTGNKNAIIVAMFLQKYSFKKRSESSFS